MNKKNLIAQQAIKAAKNQDWQLAADLNQSILDLDNNDLGALNRLGVALIQLKDKKQAQKQFEQVLSLDKSNSIAKNHLAKIKANRKVNIPTFAQNHFIEEPGKTKTVELTRLASKSILNKLTVGSSCELKLKNRFISIEIANDYVGALPEDLSFRLSKLIKNGNLYQCFVRSVNPSSCIVFLKEIKKSKKNQYTNSFPITKTQLTTINDIDDAFIEDEVPIEIVETDNDEERTFDRKEFEDNLN